MTNQTCMPYHWGGDGYPTRGGDVGPICYIHICIYMYIYIYTLCIHISTYESIYPNINTYAVAIFCCVERVGETKFEPTFEPTSDAQCSRLPVYQQAADSRKHRHVKRSLVYLTAAVLKQPVQSLIQPVRVESGIAPLLELPEQMQHHVPLWKLQAFTKLNIRCKGNKSIEVVKR